VTANSHRPFGRRAKAAINSRTPKASKAHGSHRVIQTAQLSLFSARSLVARVFPKIRQSPPGMPDDESCDNGIDHLTEGVDVNCGFGNSLNAADAAAIAGCEGGRRHWLARSDFGGRRSPVRITEGLTANTSTAGRGANCKRSERQSRIKRTAARAGRNNRRNSDRGRGTRAMRPV